jgi:hypothetical protein
MPARAYSQQDTGTRDAARARSQRVTRSSRSKPSRTARGAHAPHAAYNRTPFASFAALAFAGLLAGILFAGWRDREEGYLTPDAGLGYWLGIAGASAMLLLLIYPLRKRMPSLRHFGSVTGWFRLHMLLGVIGPALILFHCNFKLGSLNSNVALFSMLTVATSGLVGRYLYTRVHLGLYGRRTQIDDLLNDVRQLKSALEGELSLPAIIYSTLDAHVARALAERRGVLSSFVALIGYRLRSPGERAQLMDVIERHFFSEAQRQGWSWRTRRRHLRDLRRLLRHYFAAVNRAAAFAFYERLFALWHVLHMPLFVLLILAAIVHVVGAHLY